MLFFGVQWTPKTTSVTIFVTPTLKQITFHFNFCFVDLCVSSYSAIESYSVVKRVKCSFDKRTRMTDVKEKSAYMIDERTNVISMENVYFWLNTHFDKLMIVKISTFM